jgi:hypothetical protein
MTMPMGKLSWIIGNHSVISALPVHENYGDFFSSCMARRVCEATSGPDSVAHGDHTLAGRLYQ